MYLVKLLFLAVIGIFSKAASENVKITTCPLDKPIVLKDGDVLRLNISYSCPSDGCGESLAVQWRKHAPPNIKYWVDLIGRKSLSSNVTKTDQRAMLVNKTNLVLLNVTYRDAGFYKVILSTKHAKRIKPEHLFHLVIAGVPQVILRKSKTRYGIGSYFSFNCEIGGYPKPDKTVLYHEGKEVPFEYGYYVVYSLKVRDGGNYTCSATNSFGTTSQTIFLEVTAKMYGVDFTNELILYLGNKGEVICKGRGQGKLFYTIFHNGTKVLEHRADGKYTIPEVKYSDGGNYTCVATNLVQSLSKQVFYDVQVSTLIVLPHTPSTVYVLVGELLIIDLSYKLPNRWSGVKVWWYHYNKELVRATTDYYRSDQRIGVTKCHTETYRASIKNRVDLVLSNITAADNGTYRVIVGSLHNAETAWEIFNVIVQEPMAIEVKCNRDVIMEETQSIKCECIAVQGYPTPTVAWQKEGVPIPSASGLSKATLALSDTRSKQAGTYTCVGISGKLSQRKEITISVKCPTFAAVFQSGHYAMLGWQYFKIACSSNNQCGAIIKHTLKRNGEVLISNVHDAVYTIESVKISDAGLYTCVAERVGETRTTHLNLQVIDIDAPPDNSSSLWQEGKQNKTDEMSSRKCNQRWRKEWYVIFITIICAMFIGVGCGFLVKRFVLRSKKDNEITPIYHKPSTSDQSDKVQ